ncbi:flavin-containing monooxygenase [Amycolatopsis jejuensis]|uniref:flavin-containing monooxygenase n=1 Tax=Amycolatopsis jejuensis TaxID=330084 RepID=UPI000524516D|nr:NAD(P)/FAD-dependent oxidoreductase [Amycolatopsis jejuensis]
MSTAVRPVPFTRDTVRSALRDGELPTQLLTLCELTGDPEAVQWTRHITGPAPWQHDFPPALADEIRDRLADAIMVSAGDEPSVPRVRELISLSAGSATPPGQEEMVLKEMGLSTEEELDWSGARPAAAQGFHVVIIGGGISGIAAARRLRRLGIPFTLLEQGKNFGGTWLHNSYPGCGVDIASHFYSYSFAPSPQWSRYYAKQPEILSYLQSVARQSGLEDNTRFGCRVTKAEYDEDNFRWQVSGTDAAGKEFHLIADAVISAAGLLGIPYRPDYPGQETFTGTMVHSAEWDGSIDLTGRRVALVGTGASANQIGPAVAGKAAHLTVYQRTAHWNIGIDNYLSQVSDGERWLMAKVPAYARWFRARTLFSQNDINRAAQLADPTWAATHDTISAANEQMRKELTAYIQAELGDRQDLRPAVVPDYPPFSKRILRDNGWYRMLRRPDVELVPGAGLSFDGGHVIGADGQARPTDVCILATGFQAGRMLASYDVTGRGGHSIRDAWGDDDPRAHLGMAVPGFPNFFVMYGPNTNIGTGGSLIFQAENWSRYIAEALKTMIERRWAELEVRADAAAHYNERLDERLAEMVWSVSPAASWYRNSRGRVTANMPWTSFEYWEMTRRVDFSDYHVTPRAGLARRAG